MSEKRIFAVVSILLCLTVGMIIALKKDEVFAVKNENAKNNQTDNKIGEPDKNNFKKTQKESAEEIKITFLDIGQGDASFIEWSNGVQMLVDCAKDARVLDALGRVMDYFDNVIDYLLVTHPDLDHYGGCSDVLKRFEVKNIIYTGLQKNDKSWQYFWKQIQNENAKYVEIDREQEWSIASSTIHFLYPDHNLTKNANVPGLDKKLSDNNASLVFKLSYGTQDVLFTGDMEEPLEKYLLDIYGQDLNSEVLKVGHHGSGSSSNQDFLNMVAPDIATISVGKENDYGHPSLRVLKRLERAKSKILRTDKQGDIEMRITQNSVFSDY